MEPRLQLISHSDRQLPQASWQFLYEDAISPLSSPAISIIEESQNSSSLENWFQENGKKVEFLRGPLHHLSKIGHLLQANANDFLGLIRSSSRLSDTFNQVMNVSRSINSTKVVAFFAIPGDLNDVVESVMGAYKSSDLLGKVTHIVGANAGLGSMTANLWTGIQGVGAFTKISQPVMHVFDIAGPVGWGLAALWMIPTIYQGYKINQTLEQVKSFEPPLVIGTPEDKKILELQGEDNRAAMFKVFLMDDNKKPLQDSDVHSKLHISPRIPFVERESNLSETIRTIAKAYVLTKDKKITDTFVRSVRVHYRMSKLILGMKGVALLTGTVALMFFYLPALNHFTYSSHLAWGLILGTSAISLTSVVASKIISKLFIKDLEEQAASAQILLDRAQHHRDQVKTEIKKQRTNIKVEEKANILAET